MSPSDFFFLAAGLTLGVASGAVFVEVLRARPAARRGVRVTVTPGPGIGRAATLATSLGAGELISGTDDVFSPAGDRTEHPFGRAIHAGAAMSAGIGPGTQRAEAPADPCAGPRAAAADACGHAERMATLAAAAQERLREAKRAYDDHVTRRERASAAMDPRAVRTAKDEAQARFRRARLAARERAALEAAAREWLREINRINARSRDAAAVAALETSLEGGLLRDLERMGMEADGARITAEHAAETCRAARIALADCEELERVGRPAAPAPRDAAPASSPTAPGVAAGASTAAASVEGAPAPTVDVPDTGDQGTVGPPGAATVATAPGATSTAMDSPAATPAAGADTPIAGDEDVIRVDGPDMAIVRLLHGDREALRALVVNLAGDDEAEQRRWTVLLSDLVDAIIARAIDATALDFPESHPFWGDRPASQCRDIAAALAALGYRFDGLGGWADGRVPSQRDLSLALGYAGLDPMRMRRWPTEAEMSILLADVEVDAVGYVADAAGGLTMGEMVDLLGRRAEPLADLWNAWGRVRPMLLDTP